MNAYQFQLHLSPEEAQLLAGSRSRDRERLDDLEIWLPATARARLERKSGFWRPLGWLPGWLARPGRLGQGSGSKGSSATYRGRRKRHEARRAKP